MNMNISRVSSGVQMTCNAVYSKICRRKLGLRMSLRRN